jgi:Asp-tRNA(Asn)/Glu-tRNA(Gln) amidotransferase C subunit
MTVSQETLQKVAILSLEHLSEDEKSKIIKYIKSLIELTSHDKTSVT